MIINGTLDEHVTRFVVDRYEHLKQRRKDKELTWLECVRAYLSEFELEWEQVVAEGRSSRYVALSFDAVETIQSILMGVVFGRGDKFIGVAPSIPGKLKHDDEAAEEMRAYLYMLSEQSDMKRHIGILFKQLAIVGNAPYTVSWRVEHAVNYPAYQKAMLKWSAEHRIAWQEYQAITNAWKQQVMQIQQQGGEPPPPPKMIAPEPPPVQTEIAGARPHIEVGDIFNFVIDPFSADSVHSLRIKKSWVPKSVLTAMAKPNKDGYAVYENIEEIHEVARRQTTSQDDFLEERYNAFGMTVPDTDQVEIHEATGTMEIDNAHEDFNKKTFVSYIATVANNKTLIRFEPTYLWSGDSPTQLATYRDVPGHVYGIGALEPALGLQNLVNARANQVVDVVNFVLNPEFKAIDDGVIEANPKSAPNKIHWLADINNLVPIEKNMSGVQISMADLGGLKSEFQLLTKANTPVGGNTSESATKTGLDANIIAQDIGKIADHLERTVVNRVFGMFIQLCSQYVSEEEMIRHLQKGKVSFSKISPETIRRGWLFRSQGAQYYVDRQERLQSKTVFLEIASSNPLLSAAVKWLDYLKSIAEDLGIPDEMFHDGETADEILNEMIKHGFFGNPGQQAALPPQPPLAVPAPQAPAGGSTNE